MALTRILSGACAACAAMIFLLHSARADDPSPLAPVGYRNVRLAPGFWKTWQTTNRTKIIPYVLRQLEQSGTIGNFAKAADPAAGPSAGEIYVDSDLYKVLEGASYCLGSDPDPSLAAQLDQIIAKIAAAQQENGYLHTAALLRNPSRRWKNPYHHELYCAGHLLEAGVAHFEATGKRTLLDVARKLADHLVVTFGPGPQQVQFPPEHQGVELGLLRLAHATGQRRYADLAVYFLDRRGRTAGRTGYGAYGQDHRPVVEQTEAVGHAVRAFYMYSAMTDLALQGKRPDYRAPLDKIFLDLLQGKMFLSGGVGLLQHGNACESFAAPWLLPTDQPDVDTCSVIGMVYWLHRMHSLQPRGEYGDLIERILYNRLLAGVSLDGTRFFYGCPLASRAPGTFDRGPGAQCDSAHTRPKWFSCVCCPTNLPRLLATVGGYAYAQAGDEVYVVQYMPGVARLRAAKADLDLDLATDYPWDGRIAIKLRLSQPTVLTLALRIPGWAIGNEFPGGAYRSDSPGAVVLKLNGEAIDTPDIRQGYARLRRQWQTGDRIELELPLEIRRVRADARLKAAQGRVALMRGPVLYCFEGADHASGVTKISLSRKTALSAEYRAGLLGGMTVLRGSASAVPMDLIAVPFYAWDNREPGEMAVWVREELAQ